MKNLACVDYLYEALSYTGFWRLSVSSIQIMCCLALRSSRVCCCLQFHIIKEPLILSSQWDIFFQEVHLLQFFNSERNLFAWIPFSPCIAAKNTQKKVYRFSLSLGSVCRIIPTLVFLIRALQQKIILARSLARATTVSRGGYSLTRATHLKERRQ